MRGPRIRWRIFTLLVAFAAVAYFQQRTLSVAAARIMPELSLSQMQLGWLQWAFLLSYALLQFPGGVLGQRFGARGVLATLMILAVLAIAAVPLAPAVFAGTGLFVVLLGTQLVLGAAHAPLLPVSSGVMEAWLTANRWAFAQGLDTLGLQVGAALAPPVLVVLMEACGWRHALLWTALPPLALVAVWIWYGRNTPREHPSVSAAELAELGEGAAAHPAPAQGAISAQRIRGILVSRDILFATFSYICMNYVFYLLASWSFLYLIEQRHFTVLQSGWLASLPPIGAALGAGVGGGATDRLCRRWGLRWGYRLIPLLALPAAGLLLLGAVYSASASWAVAGLTLAFAAVEITEGSYWAGTMRIAQADTMAATGVLNTGGNLGGIIGVPIVAWLSGHGAWTTAFVIGCAFAFVSAVAWLGIDATRSLQAHPRTAGPPALAAA